MSTIMISLKWRVLLVNILTFLCIIVIVVGLTACSGKAGNTTDLDSSSAKAGTVENGQDQAEKTQEARPTDTPAPHVSRFAAEEAKVISGKCGKDAVWTYDTGSKLLQITGTGVVDQIIKKSEEYVTEYGIKQEYPVKEIRVGEGITALDAGPLFLNVSKVKGADEIKITLPDSLEKIGAGAFGGDHRLAKINLEQAKELREICDFNGRKYKISGDPGVPEGIDWDSVYDGDDERYGYDDPAAYKKYAYSLGTFAGTKLKSIQFPERLKYVAYSTFEHCFHLKKISIGKSFAGEINPDQLCDKKGFSLPNDSGMEIQVSEKNKHYKVRNHILYSKDGKTVYKALKSYHDTTLVLDKNVQKIGREAFSWVSEKKLQKVVVLGNLKQISREAFAVSGIKSFEVYGNVDTIGIDAFFMCYGLNKFICHGTVKHVEAQAFYYAANLGELSLGKNIESIGTGAFEGCSGFKKPRVKKK